MRPPGLVKWILPSGSASYWMGCIRIVAKLFAVVQHQHTDIRDQTIKRRILDAYEQRLCSRTIRK
jgi:hypothetical protein